MQKQKEKIVLGIIIAASILLSASFIGLAFYLSPILGLSMLIRIVIKVMIAEAKDKLKSRVHNLTQNEHRQGSDSISKEQVVNSTTTSISERSKTTNNVPQSPEEKPLNLVSGTLDNTNFDSTSISQLDKPAHNIDVKKPDLAKNLQKNF